MLHFPRLENPSGIPRGVTVLISMVLWLYLLYCTVSLVLVIDYSIHNLNRHPHLQMIHHDLLAHSLRVQGVMIPVPGLYNGTQTQNNQLIGEHLSEHTKVPETILSPGSTPRLKVHLPLQTFRISQSSSCCWRRMALHCIVCHTWK